jgi:outer membrane protein insertion porin family
MVARKKAGGVVWLFVFFVLALHPAWSEDQQPKVAVLPFVMHGQQDVVKTQKSIDEVFTRLCAREGMKLSDPQEVQKAAGSPVSSDEQALTIGKKLGVSYVVFGSFNQIGNTISIDATLVDVSRVKKPVVLLAEEKGAENLALAIGKIVQQMSVHVLSKALIVDVKVRGNDRIEAEAIKREVKSKKGELLKPEQVSEDIRAIYKMGFFEKVDAEVGDSPAGKILTFVVQENPIVQEVKVSGEKKIKEKDILAAIVTKPYAILQRNVVSDDVQKILKLYQQKGYYNAEVASKIDFPKDPHKAMVSFNIEEKNKVYIKSIDFTGNKNLTSRKLRGVMQTKVKSILSLVTDRGILQKDILETDIDRVTAYYHDAGYMDAKISSPDTVLKQDGFHISMSVEEGDRYKVTEVSLKGDLLEGYETKIMKKLDLKPGGFFSREKVRHDMDMIKRAYMNEGYARVDIDPQIQRDAATHISVIAFIVTMKEKVRIGQIFVTGNTKTKDNVIRRELTIFEGDPFNAKKIETSVNKLKKLDFFESVDVVPVDTPQKDVMDLNVKIKEKQTGTVSFGGGYSSMDGAFVTGQVQQKNLFGTGDSISIKAYLGQLASRYILSYTKPWLFGTPLSGGMDIYDWIRAYQDFTKNSLGFKMRVGYPLGQYSAVSAYYGYELGKLNNLDLLAARDPIFERGQALGYQAKSGFGVGFERNTTDHPFLPTKGTYFGADLEYDSRLFGGDFPLLKQDYHAGVYYPLFWKFVGHVRAEVGYEGSSGINSFPIYERFFLGGINSLRGWQFSQVGPVDANGLVFGGNKYTVLNTEVLFPLVEKYGVRGVLFFDTGQAFDESQNISFSKFREDVGPGLRWNSPFGPLRIEIGYILDRERSEKPYQFQFSAGAFF